MATIKNNAKATLKGKTKISRMWLIRELCKKHFGAVRPNAVQINTVIKEFGLNRYTEDGKKRSKEVIKEAMQKAIASLR
jgi:hypothetical protein